MPIGGSSGGLSSAGPGAGGGAQGPQGATGSQGAQGHQGFQGNQGTQGSSGTQGSQGNQGGAGAQGPQGVPGGSSVQVQSSVTNVVIADAPTVVAMDGASHNVHCLIASPPSWLDATGHIISPGVYQMTCIVYPQAADTTPGLFVYVADSLGAASLWCPLDPLSVQGTQVTDVISVTQGDLPKLINWQVQSSAADVTGQVNAQPQVAQLISA